MDDITHLTGRRDWMKELFRRRRERDQIRHGLRSLGILIAWEAGYQTWRITNNQTDTSKARTAWLRWFVENHHVVTR